MKQKIILFIFFTTFLNLKVGYANSTVEIVCKYSDDRYTKLGFGTILNPSTVLTACHCLLYQKAIEKYEKVDAGVIVDGRFYKQSGIRISSRFREQLDQGIHNDLGLIDLGTPVFEGEQCVEVDEESTCDDEEFVRIEHRKKGMSGMPIFNVRNFLVGILSRCQGIVSTYSRVNSSILKRDLNWEKE